MHIWSVCITLHTVEEHVVLLERRHTFAATNGCTKDTRVEVTFRCRVRHSLHRKSVAARGCVLNVYYREREEVPLPNSAHSPAISVESNSSPSAPSSIPIPLSFDRPIDLAHPVLSVARIFSSSGVSFHVWVVGEVPDPFLDVRLTS